MTKRNIGNEIIGGLEDALAYARGKRIKARVHRVRGPEHVDVRAIRRRLGVNQRDFAARFGFTLGAVRDWEQGRRQPERSARILLKIIEREPEAVERVLAG
jgi:putative transcriptional regulator